MFTKKKDISVKKKLYDCEGMNRYNSEEDITLKSDNRYNWKNRTDKR
jgi:hypothetical protein